jgi:hypothetical protein
MFVERNFTGPWSKLIVLDPTCVRVYIESSCGVDKKIVSDDRIDTAVCVRSVDRQNLLPRTGELLNISL